MQLNQAGRLKDIISIGVIGALMLAAFALLGGTGGLRIADAAPATSISGITASCGNGGYTGAVNLNGTFTGTITIALYSHNPGGQFVLIPGSEQTLTFSNSSSETYTFTGFVVPGANSYRVQIISVSPAGSLDGTTVKSASVLCSTTTTTTTTTTTSSTTSTTTTGTTTTSTTTGTTTV
jgi:hypothetical protein